MKKLLLLSVLFFSQAGFAGVMMSGTDDSTGANILLDNDTGLRWLGMSSTIGLSYNDVIGKRSRNPILV